MLAVVVIMALVLLVAVGVALYAAFPARGQQVPGVPWIGEVMGQVTEAIPTLDEYDADGLFEPSSSRRA